MKRIVLITALCSLSCLGAAGQEPAGIARLRESDPVYDSLVGVHSRLERSRDLLEAETGKLRDKLAADSGGQERYASAILTLESRLFGIRDSLDLVGGRIVQQEQQWALENLRGNMRLNTAAPATDYPYLADNSFFENELAQTELAQLRAAQQREREVASGLGILKSGYDILRSADSAYRTAPKEKADSLFAGLTAMKERSDSIAASLGSLWAGVFDEKIYIYNFLLDKTGNTARIEELEKQMANVRLRAAELAGNYMYDFAAAYPFQKALVLRYETAIAQDNGMYSAADSLKAVSREIMNLDLYLMEKLDIEERLFLDYADIAIANPPRYNTSNPIPATEIHPKGTIYRIFLGSYTKPQPVNTFRGVYPLSVERKADGKYYYYTGGYPTYEEADAAIKKARGFGFRNPRIALWHEGEYNETVTAGNSPAGSKAKARTSYRIEISNAGAGLSEQVRQVINSGAPGKEISLVSGAGSDARRFAVGTFEDLKTAEKLAEEINSADPALDINIISVP